VAQANLLKAMMAVAENSIRLSAVVPNYNHGRLIGEAIAALAAQAPPPDEIIVVDDASTDDSLDILRDLQRQHPTLRVVALERNGGAIHALNRGAREARGELVYFGAADDITMPGLFATGLDIIDRHPEAAFACCEGIVVDTETGHRGYRPPVRPAHAAVFLAPSDVAECFRHIDNWMLTGTAIVRRQLMLGAGGFDAALGAFADGYLLRKLAFEHGCCFVPHLGLIWRVSASGLSRAQAADPEDGLRTLAIALEQMRADAVFPAWYPAKFERRWRFAVCRIAAEASPMNSAVLQQVGARGPIGRFCLGAASAAGGRIGRFTALVWMSLQEWPTSFVGLLTTSLARRWARTSRPA
jgi:hypothetical protein